MEIKWILEDTIDDLREKLWWSSLRDIYDWNQFSVLILSYLIYILSYHHYTTLICSTTLDVQRPCYRTENIDAFARKNALKKRQL